MAVVSCYNISVLLILVLQWRVFHVVLMIKSKIIIIINIIMQYGLVGENILIILKTVSPSGQCK